MGIYVKFTMTTHQIWSCHVTLISNSEIFIFLPNSTLNFRNSYQIWGKLAQEQKGYRQKTNWEMENTPPPPPASACRVKLAKFESLTNCVLFVKAKLRQEQNN